MRVAIVVPIRLAGDDSSRSEMRGHSHFSRLENTIRSLGGKSSSLDVCVATDDEAIATALWAREIRAELVDSRHANDLDLVANAARRLDAGAVVMLPPNAPGVSPAWIDLAVQGLENRPNNVSATVAVTIRSHEYLLDPEVVKVVFDTNQLALCFSRSPIPCAREWREDLLSQNPPLFHADLGIHAFRLDLLLALSELQPSASEQLEDIYLLRALHAGFPILVQPLDNLVFPLAPSCM